MPRWTAADVIPRKRGFGSRYLRLLCSIRLDTPETTFSRRLHFIMSGPTCMYNELDFSLEFSFRHFKEDLLALNL